MVRITHWLNAISVAFLLWSGIAILIAFPQFHWGQTGYVGLEPDLQLPIALDTRYTTWARPMHFSFAWIFVLNGAVYLVSGFASGHFRRDFLPSHKQRPAHAYNNVQQLAYVTIVFLVLPVVVLSGLTMSPAVVAAFPWLTDLFDGRQSARFVHFIAICGLVLFIGVHLYRVIATGVVNQVRAMLTGRYRFTTGEPNE